MPSTSAKPANLPRLTRLLWETTKTIKNSLYNLLLALFLTALLVLAAFTLVTYFGQLFKYLGTINENNIFTSILANKTCLLILTFIIAAFNEFIFIKILTSPADKFKATLASVGKYAKNFFLLYLVLAAIFFIASLPINTAILFFLLNLKIQGLISIALGMLLALIASSYLIFSPYLLIEKNLSWDNALRQSFALSQSRLASIAFKLAIYAIIFVLISSLALLLSELNIIGAIASVLIFIILILYLNAFPFVLYQNIKTIKNG